jgi:hypothetical protein
LNDRQRKFHPGRRHDRKKGECIRLNHLLLKTLLPIFMACTLWAGCTSRDDAESIRTLIAKGAALAEAHDINGMLDLASADVRAMPMALDRRAVKGVLWRTFKYYGPLKVLYPRPFVDMVTNDNEASAQFPFLIVKKGQPLKNLDGLRDDPMAWIGAIGKSADLYRLRLQLIKQDGDWLVDRAVLERFTGVGFEG